MAVEVQDLADRTSFRGLADQQRMLFDQVVEANERLKSEIVELRDQIELLQSGRRDLKTQVDALREQNAQLEGRAARLEGFDSIFLCLVDGDGCVFSRQYLVDGEKGGKEAASDLKQALVKQFGGSGSYCTMLYMNMCGLRDYLVASNVCTAADFEGFVTGFNRSTELFSIVDCGRGKEAADAKIREMLKTFSAVPQIKKIVFGGGHDGGYLSVLNSLKTHGHGDKLVLLEYSQNAKVIEDLDIPRLSMPGLFLDKTTIELAPDRRLQRSESVGSRLTPHLGASPTAPLKPIANGTYSRVVSPVPANRNASMIPPPSPSTGKGKKAAPQVDRTKALMYQNPSLCNDFYLHVCIRPACTFSHEYTLTEKDITRLRAELKAMPCKGKGCRGAKDCWYRH